MKGYVGKRAKRIKRRQFYFFLIIILALIFYYFFYVHNISKELFNTDYVSVSKAEIEANEENILKIRSEYELLINTKDNKITFRDEQIRKLVKEKEDLIQSLKLLQNQNQTKKILNDSENLAIINNLQKEQNKLKIYNSELIDKKSKIEKDLLNYSSQNKEIQNKNKELDSLIKILNQEQFDIKSKNRILINENIDLKDKIKTQNELIKKLEDVTHHN